MKKFEEKLEQLKNNSHTNFYGYMGIRLLTEPEIIETFKDWVSPEDHQAEVTKLKNEINWLHNLLDGRNEEVLQTVKQLNEAIPEIPESLAKIIETHDLSVLGDWEKVVKLLSEEDLTWLSQTDNVSAVLGKAATLCNLKIKGYTVAKEKRFYLKNKLTKKFLAVRTGHEVERVKIGEYQEVRNLSPKNEGLFKVVFTQQEIDSMETGSYEKIEVEE